MKNLIIGLVVVVVVGVGAYYLISNNGSSGTPVYTPMMTNSPIPSMMQPTMIPTATSSASVSKTPMPSSSSIAVSISGFAFNPPALTIKKGTKVTWTNNDSVSHTVTSDSGSLLNSPTLAPGQTYTVTFTSVGTTAYHCSIHPNMHGSITVTN